MDVGTSADEERGCERSGGRKRSRIQQLLEDSRRKRQQLKDTIDIHKQLRDVTAGLAPGQRVYVRYEYDDILETTDDGSEQTAQVMDAKMVWWPAQLAIYSPGAHLGLPSQTVVSAGATPAEQGARPTALTDEEKARQYTAAEVFGEIQEDLSDEDRSCMVDLMKTHADKIVYTLDYEGREAFGPESIPCFFIDEDNLMHLHKCWGSAVYRTESNIDEVNREEPLEDGISAVANLFVEEGDLSNLGEVAEKVMSMLTNFYRHADQVGSRTMSADDVCEYFAQRPEMTIVLTRLNPREAAALEASDEELIKSAEDAAAAADESSRAALADQPPESSAPPRLEDKPFPRRS